MNCSRTDIFSDTFVMNRLHKGPAQSTWLCLVKAWQQTSNQKFVFQVRNKTYCEEQNVLWGTKRIVVVIANGLPDSEIRLVTGDDSPKLRLSTIVASHTSVSFAWQSQKQSVVECFCWGVLGQIFQVFVKMAFSPLNCIHIGFSAKIQNRHPEIVPCAKFQPN